MSCPRGTTGGNTAGVAARRRPALASPSSLKNQRPSLVRDGRLLLGSWHSPLNYAGGATTATAPVSLLLCQDHLRQRRPRAGLADGVIGVDHRRPAAARVDGDLEQI